MRGEEESSSTSSESDPQPRQYSLRQRRPTVTFRQEQVRQLRQRREPPPSAPRGSTRRPSRRARRSSSSDTSGEDYPRRDSSRRGGGGAASSSRDRSRFMPINMNEKELSAVERTLKERMRKTGGGQGSSDIDPMSIDETVTFETVGGLSHHIQSLKEVVLFPMLYPEVFEKFNLNPPKGVVFYGPPGCGKTLVARALANECRKGASKVAFFMRKGADCLSKWVGESERQLRLLFDQAYAMRPSIIFFDEIDGLAPVRSSKQDQIHASIVSTLLALMDGLDGRGEVVVIGATNRLDTLDPALRRPGRFDRELRFSLPDLTARHQILDIHTSKWNNNKPSAETIESIAEQTSGYCGADLKFLCTEAVLIALRTRYPHIYMQSEKLRLDVDSIKVTTEHFRKAMRRITPASRRDLAIPSRPLETRTRILIGDAVDAILTMRIPSGYRNGASDGFSKARSELEKVVRALDPGPVVPATRLLLTGTIGLADGGQTSYVLPAILSKLDHLPVFSLSVSSLLSDGRPEESFSNIIQSAIRAASTGPAILLLPSIDEWLQVVPVSVQHMLVTCVDGLTGYTPILLLASLDSSIDDASEYVKDLFRQANCVKMLPIKRILRQKYFDHVLEKCYEPPVIFDESQYDKPEIVTAETQAAAPRKISEAEARELEKMYLSALRQLRIFLRDRLNRLMRDRRFLDFVMPVDVEDAADYYEIIEKPMCLTDMMDKLDNKKYIHADQFLDDIRQITANALEYNPACTQDGKTLRFLAIGLRDVAEELFDSELDENFVAQLEETSRLLKEAAVKPDDEKLSDIPRGFQRVAPWSIKNSLAKEVAVWRAKFEPAPATPATSSVAESKEDIVKEKSKSKSKSPEAENAAEKPHHHRRKRSKSYNFPGQKKRKPKSSQAEDKNEEASDGEETGDDTMMEDEEHPTSSGNVDGANSESGAGAGTEQKPEIPMDLDENESSRQSEDVVVAEKEQFVLKISKDEILALIAQCVEKTEGWSVSEFERLASVMTHQIEQYREIWNREELPAKLESIVENWQPYHRNEESEESQTPPKPTQNGCINGH
ncbi:unnamed protein product [Caenorhabditis angaria]|uniref:Tat-binding homolog 7 n=1 Tax=Caenorhabditis angaria TaxID=860376 RepID=A0A9P1IMP5_9PELO|nr:unnamed protein product [Caenorhabditis angaria]